MTVAHWRAAAARAQALARPLHTGLRRAGAEKSASAAPAEIKGVPYADLKVGVPKESAAKERRVAVSPAVTANLVKKGFSVLVEENAGALASFPNQDYEAAGAKIVPKKEAFQSGKSRLGYASIKRIKSLSLDIVLKLRQPSNAETKLFREEGTLYSFLYPKQNQALIDELAKRKLTAFGMDCVPRISRAQVFDALSSMSNISGYRAVVEASNHFGRFFTGNFSSSFLL